MRAFTANLQRQTGVAYVPQYMDETAYNAIVNSAGGGTQGSGNRGNGSQDGYGRLLNVNEALAFS